MDKRKDKPWKQVISEETKKQISETLTGRIFVSKDGKNKNIYPEELEYYLSLGYERKMIKKKKNNDVRLFSDEFPEGILITKIDNYLIASVLTSVLPFKSFHVNSIVSPTFAPLNENLM